MRSPAKFRLQVGAFVILDIIAIGAGMGVPIFAIALGLPVGWFLPGFLGLGPPYTAKDLRGLLRASAIASVVSLAVLALIWLPTLQILVDPASDLANFGIPMILYEPLPSFIGWIVLMVLISPVMQMVVILFGSVLGCAFRPGAPRPSSEPGKRSGSGSA